VHINPRFSGHPTLSIYTKTWSPTELATQLFSGGQVTYKGSRTDLHGPFAVVGQCACPNCTPDPADDDETFADRFRLVITNGVQELVCVHPTSVIPRSTP
jgi:hypothetical protein